MFINKDSIIIDDISFGKYLVSAKYGYHKLWGKDTGRTLSFKMTGTLGGIFPKITLNFSDELTQEDLNIITPILDKEEQTLKYDDPNLKKQIILKTYTGDYEILYKGIEEHEAFSCSFISKEKRK